MVKPPVVFQLVRAAGTNLLAYIDALPGTTTKVSVGLVQVSGPEQEKLASYPLFQDEDQDYAAGDIVRFIFPRRRPAAVRGARGTDDRPEPGAHRRRQRRQLDRLRAGYGGDGGRPGAAGAEARSHLRGSLQSGPG